MRKFCVVMLFVAGAALAGSPSNKKESAADVAPVQSLATPPRPVMVAAPTKKGRRFDRVIYVIDLSCSMTMDNSRAVLDGVAVTSLFASDDTKAAVITFDATHTLWAGVKERCAHPRRTSWGEPIPCDRRCPEKGWITLPKSVAPMQRWIRTHAPRGGATLPGSALACAYRRATESTRIVFISDGNFDLKRALPPLKKEIARRRKKKLAPAQMLVWSTATGRPAKTLFALAEIGGAGLWRASRRR